MSVARASAPSSWARTFRPSFSVLTPLLSLFLPPFRSASSLPSSSVSSALLDFLSLSISLWIDPSLPRAFYTLLSNGSKLVSDHRARSTLLPSFMEMAITLLILVEHFLRNGEGRRGDRWGPRWKMEISISKKFNFVELRVYRFFPSNFTWFCFRLYLRLGRKSRKIFIFSDRIVFQRNGIRGETQFVSLFSTLFFSLSSYSTPLHTSFYSPSPPRKFEKSQRPRTGTLSRGWQTSMFRCFGVFSREKFGRPPFWAVSFQPSLENDAVARTAKSSSPSSPLLSPGDVVISVSSWGKFALFKHQPEILGGNNLADSSGSYNDPTPTNYFVSTVEMIPLY